MNANGHFSRHVASVAFFLLGPGYVALAQATDTTASTREPVISLPEAETRTVSLDDALSQAIPLPTPEWAPSTGEPTPEGEFISHHLVTGETRVGQIPILPPTEPFRQSPEGPGLPGPPEGPVPNSFGTLSLVSTPEAFPWRMNVKILFQQESGWYVCSGVLIDPRWVMTAGHCLFSHDNSEGWADNLQVIPGYDSGNQPYGYASSVVLHAFTGWTTSQNFDYDLGWVELDRPVGALTGWFGYGYESDTFVASNSFNNPGYPAESPYTGEHLYNWFGTYDDIQPQRLYHNEQSYGGQSGSGSYVVLSSDRIQYAVHSHTLAGVSGDTRLTSGKFDTISGSIATNTPSTVDLVPLDVDAEPATVEAGSALTSFEYVIHNNSTATWTGTVNVQVYLSTNDNISSTDRLLQTRSYTGTIDAKATQDVAASSSFATIPSDVAPGAYWIGVILDIEDADVSNNDTDGWDAAPLTVTAAPLPDLVVSSLSCSPPTPGVGESVTCTAVVLNDGTVVAPASQLEFRVGGESSPPQFETGSLAPGSSSSAIRTWTPTVEQSYLIVATADVAGVVEESNESNNERQISLSVGPSVLPDLIPIAIVYQAPPWVMGSSKMATLREENIGTSSAGPHQSRLYLSTNATISTSDTPLGDPLPFETIPAGTTMDRSLTFTVPTLAPGNYYLGALTDIGLDVPEADESNNAFHASGLIVVTEPTRTLTVNSSPITGISITGSPPTYSGTTNFAWAGIVTGTSLTLTAPESDPPAYHWLEWSCTGPTQTTTSKSIAITMGADRICTATYEPAGLLGEFSVFLQGPYSGGTMSTALKTGGLIPLTDPYGSGTSVSSIPDGVVDWVKVELRTGSPTSPPMTVVGSEAAFVKSDGTVVSHLDGDSPVQFGEVEAASYFVVVSHRNHLPVMSATSVDCGGGTCVWDFTDEVTKAYGIDALRPFGDGRFGQFAADGNGDRQVTAPDFNLYLAQTTAGATGYKSSDYNLDGQVTAPDFNLYLANTTIGAHSGVPLP